MQPLPPTARPELRASIRAAGEAHGWFVVIRNQTDVFRLPDSRMYLAITYRDDDGAVSWATTPMGTVMGQDKVSRIVGLLTKESKVRARA
jgi:hypothetical protein